MFCTSDAESNCSFFPFVLFCFFVGGNEIELYRCYLLQFGQNLRFCYMQNLFSEVMRVISAF